MESPTKGHEDVEASSIPTTGGKAQRAGTVQPGEEKAQRDLINVSEYLQGGCKADRDRLLSVMPSTRTRATN